jgi:hypothetical protein
MSAFPLTMAGQDEALPPSPKLQELHGTHSTRRVAELKARIDDLRAQLKAAEEELEREESRIPAIDDFVRCPLTGFFGRVTKVTPRPYGRAWVEILLYLGEDLPGHATIDLFGNWELIDPPIGEPKL